MPYKGLLATIVLTFLRKDRLRKSGESASIRTDPSIKVTFSKSERFSYVKGTKPYSLEIIN